MSIVEFPVPVTSKKQGKSKSLPPYEPPKDPVTYGDIELNFGKYNGKKLKDVAVEDPKYCQWIKNRFKENQELTPTMKAILKFCETV